jgi:hypothetical protein
MLELLDHLILPLKFSFDRCIHLVVTVVELIAGILRVFLDHLILHVHLVLHIVDRSGTLILFSKESVDQFRHFDL